MPLERVLVALGLLVAELTPFLADHATGLSNPAPNLTAPPRGSGPRAIALAQLAVRTTAYQLP